MTKKDQITTIIPAYNAEKFLAAAIESVLAQTIKPDEIIVVNDGSVDNTAKIAQDYSPEITLIDQKNRGVSGAKNSGILKAEGSLLTFLDADDLWPPNHIELLLAVIQSDSNLDMVFGHVEQFRNPEDSESPTTTKSDRKVMPGYLAGSSLIRKEVFDKVGLLNEDLTLADFVDWFSRAKDEKISYTLIPEIVLKRRLHTDNIGIREKSHLKDYTKVLMASIKRKREQK